MRRNVENRLKKGIISLSLKFPLQLILLKNFPVWGIRKYWKSKHRLAQRKAHTQKRPRHCPPTRLLGRGGQGACCLQQLPDEQPPPASGSRVGDSSRAQLHVTTPPGHHLSALLVSKFQRSLPKNETLTPQGHLPFQTSSRPTPLYRTLYRAAKLGEGHVKAGGAAAAARSRPR